MTSQTSTRPAAWRQTLHWFDGRGRSLGLWAFILNRLTGLLLAAYIPVHLIIISSLYRGEAAWDNLMALFRSPFALIFDVGLLLALLFHSLNGIRLVLLALNIGVGHQKALFWGLMGVGGMALLAAAARLFNV